MRSLLFLPLFLVSCAGPSRTTIVDGSTSMTVEETGSLGGKTFSHVTKSKSGALSITKRNDMEGSFRDATQAAVTGIAAWQMGLSSRATTASDAAVATGAQKADVAKAAQAAAVETQRIKSAEVIATIPKP